MINSNRKKCCICGKKGYANYHDIQTEEKLYLCDSHGILWEKSQERHDFFHDRRDNTWESFFKKWLLKRKVTTKEKVNFT
jgi:tRNA(His) 5'-end guanylyltransferase